MSHEPESSQPCAHAHPVQAVVGKGRFCLDCGANLDAATEAPDTCEILFSLSLDGGADEECGSSTEGNGWHGFLRGPITAEEILRAVRDAGPSSGLECTEAQAEEIARELVGGAILHEDTQGFHDFDSFADADEARKAWAELVAEVEPSDEDEAETPDRGILPRVEAFGLDAEHVLAIRDGFARAAWADAWASAIERAREDGDERTFPNLSGVDILDAAPDTIPGAFLAFARSTVRRALAGAPDSTLQAWGEFLQAVAFGATQGADALGRYLYLDAVGHGAGLRDLGHEHGRGDSLHVAREVLGHHETPLVDASEIRDASGDYALPTVEDIVHACAHGAKSTAEATARAVLGVLRAWESANLSEGQAFSLANRLLGGHGSEEIDLVAPEDGERGLTVRYVNRGDTYDSTLCLVDGERWLVSSWGDLVEGAERERTERTGETSCPYCGAWGLGGLSEDGLDYLRARDTGEACEECGHVAE